VIFEIHQLQAVRGTDNMPERIILDAPSCVGPYRIWWQKQCPSLSAV